MIDRNRQTGKLIDPRLTLGLPALLAPVALGACALGDEVPVTVSAPPGLALHARFAHAYEKNGRIMVTGEILGRPGPIRITVEVAGCGSSTFNSTLPHPPRAMAQSFNRIFSCPAGIKPGPVTVSVVRR